MGLLGSIAERILGRPSEDLGRIGSRVVSATNADAAAAVVDELDLEPTDRVLEVGFGPGAGIERAAEAAADGYVAGVDHSQTMVERATRRNRAEIEAGHVDLRYGSASDLPFADATFDAAFSIDSVHVWSDPRAGVAELARVLKPGGTVAVALTARAGRLDEPLERLLRETGFEDVRRTEPAETVIGTTAD